MGFLNKYATSKNLTVIGILAVVQAIVTLAVATFDGNPETVPDIYQAVKEIVAGAALILAKGAASTGGTTPETAEAAARLKIAG